MSNKSKGVVGIEAYKPASELRLEGAHAKKFKGHPIGKKISMMITGTKTRHSMEHDGNHSASFKVNSVNDSNQALESDGGKDDADTMA